MGRLLRFTALAAVALAAASCLSPTLPLPPPDQPDSITPNTDGTFTVSGTCAEGALVTVFDETSGEGRVVEDLTHSGRYSVHLEASQCDTAWVSQEVNEQPSTQTFFVVEPISGGDPTGGACTN